MALKVWEAFVPEQEMGGAGYEWQQALPALVSFARYQEYSLAFLKSPFLKCFYMWSSKNFNILFTRDIKRLAPQT